MTPPNTARIGGIPPLPSETAAIHDPLLRRLLRHWNSEREGRAAPARDSIDPVKLRFIIGQIALIDVVDGTGRFHVRILGAGLVSALGSDFTGKASEELPSGDLRRIATELIAAATAKQAPHCARIHRVIDGFVRRFEALVLPYSGRQGRLDLLMLAIRCRAPHSEETNDARPDPAELRGSGEPAADEDSRA